MDFHGCAYGKIRDVPSIPLLIPRLVGHIEEAGTESPDHHPQQDSMSLGSGALDPSLPEDLIFDEDEVSCQCSGALAVSELRDYLCTRLVLAHRQFAYLRLLIAVVQHTIPNRRL